jgi:MFS family permease
MKKLPANNKPSFPVTPGALRKLPAGIWALGFVSLLMDASSELVHSLLPVFMVTVLGASMITIGIIEGVAEATAAVTKVFSGVISDYLGRRKLLAVLGYGLAALTKPIFPLATTIGWVFAARFVDRIGKGIRGAPRDALVADITPAQLRGAAYGLRQSLDSVGAFVGPLLALALMALLANNIHAVLWVAVIPAFLAVALLIFGVSEHKHAEGHVRMPITLKELKKLSLRFWLVVLLGAVFTLARFSEAFLILRAQDVGLALGYIPMVLIVMNIVYAATAYPAGAATDRIGHRTTLVWGLGILVIADIILAMTTSPVTALIGAAFWGLHMGFTQGLLSKLVADNVPAALRGSAFGIFNLVSGVALLLASVIAGALWSIFGAPATFLAGAVFAALPMAGLIAWRRNAHNTHSKL